MCESVCVDVYMFWSVYVYICVCLSALVCLSVCAYLDDIS